MAFPLHLLVLTILYTTSPCYCGHNKDFHLTILHTSDVTGSFQQFNSAGDDCNSNEDKTKSCLGGVARHATVINKVRSEREHRKNINVLLLDAGDHLAGEWFDVYDGEATSHFMNQLEYDAVTFGNLDFSLGPKCLASFLEASTFDAVSANLNVSQEPALQGVFKKSVVKSYNGEHVAIIGYTFQRTNEIAIVGNARFEDVVKSVKEEVNQLESLGINKIIVLGHTYGLVQDGNDAIDIARNVPGVDVIVLGGALLFQCNDCSHSDEDKEAIYRIEPYPMVIVPNHDPGDKVLLVHGYIDGRYIGRLNVVFDDEGHLLKWNGDPIRLDNRVKQDKYALADINGYAEKVQNIWDNVIGSTLVKLQGGSRGEEICRQTECTMGNLITDAMIWYYKTTTFDDNKWNNVSIAVMNGGGIRASINKGDIKLSDLVAVLPFHNTFDAIEIEGKYIRDMLEIAVARYDKYSGAFLQMSGMMVTYNMTRPPYQRVVEVVLSCGDCKPDTYYPLNDTQVYKIALSSFIRNGGDGYGIIKENALHNIVGDSGRDAVASYIEKFSPVSPGIELRIILHPDGDTQPRHKRNVTIDAIVYVVVAGGILLLLGLVYKMFALIQRRKKYSNRFKLMNEEPLGDRTEL